MSADFQWHGDEFERIVRGRIVRFLLKLAEDFERTMTELFRAPKHGRLYKRGRRWHRASAPGEAPAVDRGRLWRSIRHMIENEDSKEPAVLMGTTIGDPPYPRYLEDGTKRMRPRPAWIRALEIVKRAAPFIAARMENDDT